MEILFYQEFSTIKNFRALRAREKRGGAIWSE